MACRSYSFSVGRKFYANDPQITWLEKKVNKCGGKNGTRVAGPTDWAPEFEIQPAGRTAREPWPRAAPYFPFLSLACHFKIKSGDLRIKRNLSWERAETAKARGPGMRSVRVPAAADPAARPPAALRELSLPLLCSPRKRIHEIVSLFFLSAPLRILCLFALRLFSRVAAKKRNQVPFSSDWIRSPGWGAF